MAQLTDLEKVRKRRARRRAVKGVLTLAVFALVVFGCAVSVVAFFVVNAITLKAGAQIAPSAYLEEK